MYACVYLNHMVVGMIAPHHDTINYCLIKSSKLYHSYREWEELTNSLLDLEDTVANSKSNERYTECNAYTCIMCICLKVYHIIGNSERIFAVCFC